MPSHQSSVSTRTRSTAQIDPAVALLPADEYARQAACEEYWKDASVEWLEENAEDLLLEFVKSQKVEGGAIIADCYTYKAHYFAQIGYGKKKTVVREDALAAHLFTLDNPGMIVEDAALDPGFCNHPQVVYEPYIRFFCCAPLKTKSGHIFGTVEIFDHKPRRILEDIEDKILEFCDRIMQGLSPPGQSPATERSSSPISIYLKSPYEEPDLIPRALFTPRMPQQQDFGVPAAASPRAHSTGKRFSRGSIISNKRQPQSCPAGHPEAESILAVVPEEEEEYSFNRSDPFEYEDLKPLGLKVNQQPQLSGSSSQLSLLDENDTTLKPQDYEAQREPAGKLEQTGNSPSTSSAGFEKLGSAAQANRGGMSTPVSNDPSGGGFRDGQSRDIKEPSASNVHKPNLSVSSIATSSTDSEGKENRDVEGSSNSRNCHQRIPSNNHLGRITSSNHQDRIPSNNHLEDYIGGSNYRKISGSRPTKPMSEDQVKAQIKAQATKERAVQLTKSMTMQSLAGPKGKVKADLKIMEKPSTGYPIDGGYESLNRDVANLGRDRVLADPRWDDSNASQRLAQVHLRNMPSVAHGQLRLRNKQSKDWNAIPVDKTMLYKKELQDAGGQSITVQDFRSQFTPKPRRTRGNPEDDWTKDYPVDERQHELRIQHSRLQIDRAAQDQNVEPTKIPAPLLNRIIKFQPKPSNLDNVGEKAAAIEAKSLSEERKRQERRLSDERKKAEKEAKRPKTAAELERLRIEARDANKLVKDAERIIQMGHNREAALRYVRGRKAEIEENLARNPRPNSEETIYM